MTDRSMRCFASAFIADELCLACVLGATMGTLKMQDQKMIHVENERHYEYIICQDEDSNTV